MALKKRIAAARTHFPNLEKKPAGETESGSKVKNHYEAQDLLVDPQDDEGGSTHTPVNAANSPDDEDLDIDSLDQIDADLYDEEDEEPEDEPISSILDDQDDEEVDDDLEDAEDIDADVEVDDESGNEDLVEGDIESEEFAAEGIPLVDVDDVADEVEDPEEELTVASLGSSLHIIRSNRIIASMTKRQAIKASKEDIYQEDSFHTVVASEVQKAGLRKGLTALGFTLATVAVDSTKALKATVATKVAAATIQAQKSLESQQQALAQSLAIAAVGINRKFFKDAKNDLKAALEADLHAAGVRGASRIVSAAFAEHGISYANTLVTLATKLAAMPEETRDQFAEALDLTDDGAEDEEDDDQVEASEFDMDDAEDGLDVPSTVSAALRSPLRSTKVRASRSSESTAVQDVLSGNKPLPYVM